MKSSIRKWSKKLTYSVSREESWLVVEDNPYTWIYVTKKDIDDSDLKRIIKESGVRPEFVKKKGIYDMLRHFGIIDGVKEILFQKEKSDIEVNV